MRVIQNHQGKGFLRSKIGMSDMEILQQLCGWRCMILPVHLWLLHIVRERRYQWKMQNA